MKTSRLIKHATQVLGAGAALCLTELNVAAYDLSADYSATSNPNGVWSYGAMTNLGGTFSPFTIHTAAAAQNGVIVDVWGFGGFNPEIWHNGTASTATSDGTQGVFPPGTVALFPGSPGIAAAFGVSRFTAPQAGSYLLQTAEHAYLHGVSSHDCDFHVLDNGIQIFGQLIPANSGTSYTTTVNLLAGDTIDFVVGRGTGNGNFTGVTIQASLNPVPEPTTFALAGLGSAVLLMIRRRK